MLIAPIVLVIIFISLYLAFKSIREAILSLITIPFALIGGAYIVYFWGVNLSIAVAVGFIALFGIAVMTGIVMVIYLNDAMRQLVEKKGNSSETITRKDLQEYVIRGAAGRLRSEEHTSELQSLMRISYAVFCLKKKKKQTHRMSNLCMRPTR